MRMSRATTLLHLLLGLRTSASASTSVPTPTALSSTQLLNKSPASTLFAQCHAANLYSTFQYKPSSPLVAKTYSTMSNQASSNPQNPSPESSSKDKSKPVLALPDSSTASNDVPQLDVNGDGVKLDHLGPLVVNTDGTLARISNWAQMTEIERKNTLRILGKRNKERMAKLKAQAGEEQSKSKGRE